MGSRVAVERIDAEPLTVDQHRDAVAALAALIDRWIRPGENTIHDDVRADIDSADPTDVPGPDAYSSRRRDHDPPVALTSSDV